MTEIWKALTTRRKLAAAALALTLVALMCFIFMRSAKDSVESSRESEKVTEKIAVVIEKVIPSYKKMTETERVGFLAGFQNTVRNAAHFSLFLLLGINAAALLYTVKPARGNCLRALIFSVIYALSDETHQLFVPGRSMELRDILTDAAGACVGIAIVYAVYRIAVHFGGRNEIHAADKN